MHPVSLGALLCLTSAMILPVHIPDVSARRIPTVCQVSEPAGCTTDPCKPPTSQLMLLSYSLKKDDQNVENWKEDETADLTLYFQDAGLKTNQLAPDAKAGDKIDSIEASELLGDFTQPKTIMVTLMSSGSETLKFSVEYTDLLRENTGSTFNYSIGYPALDIAYTTGALNISQAKENPESPDSQDQPADDQPVPDDSGSEIPGSGWNGGWSGNDYDFNIPDTSPAQPDGQAPQGTDSPAGDENSQEIPAASPNIIIKHYSYGDQAVQAGSAFTLTIDFFNTSRTIPVENIVMQVETDTGLSITNASNTYYFESLQPRYNLQQKIGLKALSTDNNTSPSINVTFNYEYVDQGNRATKTSSEKISIPVYEPDRMEITEPVITETALVGQEMALSFPYVNKGKGTLYNVSVRVEGDMESLLPVQNLGNFEPGKSGSVDIILTPESGGERTFDVVMSYEDASGKQIAKKFPYSLNVEEAGMGEMENFEDFPSDMMEPDESENSSGNGLWWIIAGLAGIALVAALLVLRRRRDKGSNNGGADDDFDYFADDSLPDLPNPAETSTRTATAAAAESPQSSGPGEASTRNPDHQPDAQISTAALISSTAGRSSRNRNRNHNRDNNGSGNGDSRNSRSNRSGNNGKDNNNGSDKNSGSHNNRNKNINNKNIHDSGSGNSSGQKKAASTRPGKNEGVNADSRRKNRSGKAGKAPGSDKAANEPMPAAEKESRKSATLQEVEGQSGQPETGSPTGAENGENNHLQMDPPSKPDVYETESEGAGALNQVDPS